MTKTALVRRVRPGRVFELCGGVVSLPMPQSGDSMSVLETCLILAAARSVDARRYFEFGTYLGRTTLNLAMNAHQDARIFTFDLDSPVSQVYAEDTRIMHQHFTAPRMAFEGTEFAARIHRLYGNSLTWTPPSSLPQMDFIFVDGGHDYDTVKADTENALKMLAPGGVIAWHDYNAPGYPDVSEYLDDLSEDLDIVHAEDTKLAFAGLRVK